MFFRSAVSLTLDQLLRSKCNEMHQENDKVSSQGFSSQTIREIFQHLPCVDMCKHKHHGKWVTQYRIVFFSLCWYFVLLACHYICSNSSMNFADRWYNCATVTELLALWSNDPGQTVCPCTVSVTKKWKWYQLKAKGHVVTPKVLVDVVVAADVGSG